MLCRQREERYGRESLRSRLKDCWCLLTWPELLLGIIYWVMKVHTSSAVSRFTTLILFFSNYCQVLLICWFSYCHGYIHLGSHCLSSLTILYTLKLDVLLISVLDLTDTSCCLKLFFILRIWACNTLFGLTCNALIYNLIKEVLRIFYFSLKKKLRNHFALYSFKTELTTWYMDLSNIISCSYFCWKIYAKRLWSRNRRFCLILPTESCMFAECSRLLHNFDVRTWNKKHFRRAKV